MSQELKPHPLAEILHAVADGKPIQFFSPVFKDWVDYNADLSYLDFNSNIQYRVKPRPKVKKWKWVLRDTRNDNNLIVSADYYRDYRDAVEDTMRGYFTPVQIIHSTMIEVEE